MHQGSYLLGEGVVNNSRAQYLATWLQSLRDANYRGYVMRVRRNSDTKNYEYLVEKVSGGSR